MNEIKLENYKIPARNLAEQLWGRGGTTALKTNRKGVYYFTCSAHGGYIMDAKVLSDQEKTEIMKQVHPIKATLFIQHRKDGDYVLAQDFQGFGGRPARCCYAIEYGPIERVEYPIYVFEEDCEYKVLESCTDIRVKMSNQTL